MDMIWYESLNKPALTPQAWVFTPAWIFLYGLILLSLFTYIYASSDRNKLAGYIFFAIQMILNLSWVPVFFNMKNIMLSFVIIILLFLFIIMTIAAFYRISKIAAALLIPYLLWICFAAYLNYEVMVLNL